MLRFAFLQTLTLQPLFYIAHRLLLRFVRLYSYIRDNKKTRMHMAILRVKKTSAVTSLTNLTNLNYGLQPLQNKGWRLKVSKWQTLTNPNAITNEQSTATDSPYITHLQRMTCPPIRRLPQIRPIRVHAVTSIPSENLKSTFS